MNQILGLWGFGKYAMTLRQERRISRESQLPIFSFPGKLRNLPHRNILPVDGKNQWVLCCGGVQLPILKKERAMSKKISVFALLGIVVLGATSAFATEWKTDYGEAMKTAESAHKMLFVLFADEGDKFGSEVAKWLDDPGCEKYQETHVFVRLPLAYSATLNDKPLKILSHSAFSILHSRAGIAILDTRKKESPQFRRVVSAYPSEFQQRLSLQRFRVILELPEGTLAQRSLIMAVRFHPESPQSTAGEQSATLVREASSHSSHQARIRRQGHHNWEQRFHSINSALPDGLVSKEICAESWPNEELLQAAFECVHSWRQSPGHWNAVRERHVMYGYDMKRGSNGIWYATGIFGGHY
ncbi:MAG: hypothetical protein ACI9G1_001063 [Pirellulaceae bacterium]|jgi:hypothetical protein